MGQAYKVPLDIINRALQHCRKPRAFSANDNNLDLQEALFAYDKIRRRELRRNTWRFATKRVALRPLASTTVLLAPTLWDAGTTYFGGQIVADAQGNVWVNLISRNTGNIPGLPGSGWDAYFGPLTITPWNQPSPPTGTSASSNPYAPLEPGGQYGSQLGSIGYFTGELVYIPDGQGNASIFQATVTTGNSTGSAANVDGPYTIDTWSPSVTYSKGQIAFIYTDASGALVLGVPPGLGVGGLTSTAFQSTIDLNTGNQPDLCEVGAVVPWSATTTYTVGDHVVGSDNQIYQAVQSANTGNDPFSDRLFVWWIPLAMYANTWTPTITPVPRAASNQWQYIPGSTFSTVIPYPLTAGPVDNLNTRNAYMLPAGYLREAPPDPKVGGIGFLGAPSGYIGDADWVYEGQFLISNDFRPIVFRFVADVTDVTQMDDMFCEGLAAELAAAIAPSIQPDRNDVIQLAKADYEETINEARVVNAIETGDVQPPIDEYLTCRF